LTGRLGAAGRNHERAIEALVHEICITDQGVIPVFKIPGPGGGTVIDNPTTPGPAVRAMVR
jgi:hypothetical protein